MIIDNTNTKKLVNKLIESEKNIDLIIKLYLDEYADFGWDDFTESLANVKANLNLLRTRVENFRTHQQLDDIQREREERLSNENTD